MPRDYEIDLSGGREAVIGLEIHVSLASKSKLFCDCFTNYHEVAPNVNVCQTCLSQPGSKPFGVNEQAVENAVKIALALGCKISSSEIVMQRKHYWYPDLPSGYQRTSTPLGEEGALLGVRIREVHVEEDPGRYNLKTGQVDFNRSGVPLLEIVTEPDIRSPDQARAFLDELQSILEYLGAAKKEAGSTRIDANVSVPGSSRVEVKNINSFKGVLTALTYELARQKNLVKNGMKVEQETRHFDEDRGITLGLRKKESVDDYRYVPDPDVLPIAFESSFIHSVRSFLPELPREKRARFEKQYSIKPEEAFAICLEKETADAFEQIAKKTDAKAAANFMRGVLRKQLNFRDKAFSESGLSVDAIVELLGLVNSGEATEKVGEQILIKMLDEKVSPRRYAEQNGLLGVQSSSEVEAIVGKVVAENAKVVADFKAGNEKSLHFLAGLVMKQTRGKADPASVQKLLKKTLG